MSSVQPLNIKLTDKLEETRNNERGIHIVNNGKRQDFTWKEVNDLADRYALAIQKYEMVGPRNGAIIGLYSMDVSS